MKTVGSLFDAGFIADQTGVDVAKEKHPLEYYLKTMREVDPHPLFSVSWYRSHSPDIDCAASPLLHFIEHGASELRSPHPLFDPHWYLSRNLDYPEARINPLLHYMDFGWRVGCSVHPLFDAKWYLENNPDVAAAGVDPLCHYLLHGGYEGRNPSPHFGSAWYLNEYPDVAAQGINPLVHYLTSGASEGRDPSPSFSSTWYLRKYPDVQVSGMNPLWHYAAYGIAEERIPAPAFHLDQNYGMPADSFVEWRDQVLARARRKQSKGRAQDAAALRGRLVAIISPSDGQKEVDACSGLAAQTLSAAALELGLDSRLTTLEKMLVKIETAGLSDTLVLFIQDADRLDAPGLIALWRAWAQEAKLVVFDAFFQIDGVFYPVLQPGANIQYLRSVDGSFSRFAIRGDLLREILEDGRVETPLDILRRAIDSLVGANDWDRLIHCALPVLETSNLRVQIISTRAEIIKRTKDGTEEPTADDLKRSISIVICTKDKGHLLDQLLRGLLRDCGELIADIIIVSNQTTNAYARETLARWTLHPMVKVIRYEKPFNFSEQCNVGVAESGGRYLLFLNDDIVAVTPHWLRTLLAQFSDSTIGVAGPLLLYPNENVQHAGMFMGFRAGVGGAAGHILRHANLPDGDYLYYATAPRDVSCVTGAVLLMRRECFDDLNGFDEQLKSIYQDVDLCLRISNLGYRLVYIPQAILLHMESVSVLRMLEQPGGQEQRDRELAYFIARHGWETIKTDRYFNPNHSAHDEALRTLIC